MLPIELANGQLIHDFWSFILNCSPGIPSQKIIPEKSYQDIYRGVINTTADLPFVADLPPSGAGCKPAPTEGYCWTFHKKRLKE
jgi:hypothetical protein